MRRLLLVLLFLLPACPTWGHPMPSSSIVLWMQRTQIEAELILPIGELSVGWEKPLPLDGNQLLRNYGSDLENYVLLMFEQSRLMVAPGP